MTELSKFNLKMIKNSDPCDIDNMCQALVEMLSDKKPKNLNICNLHMYLDSMIFIEISSFNEKYSDWEPILEPWSANFNIQQIEKITRKKIQFNSDLMLNFNISVNSIQILNKIIKKINQNPPQWKKEDMDCSNQIKEVNKLKIDNAIIFENKSGLDLTFNFVSDEEKKYNLLNNTQKSFSKNDLNIIYQSLSSEIAIKKKDKFSFFFKGINFPIEEIDFSYNHFIIKKLPLGINTYSLYSSTEKNNINKKYIEEENKFEKENNFVEICIKIKNNASKNAQEIYKKSF